MAKSAKALSKLFQARVETAINHHAELLLAVSGKTRQAALETLLCEQFALNIMVLWEVFLSDLIIQYLSASPKKFTSDLKARLLQSVKEKFGAHAGSMVSISLPSSVSVSKARSLADHKSYNLTSNSAANLSDRANRLLSARFARRFTLDPEDAAFFDYVVALRNYLAHRSEASQEELKKKVGRLSGSNQHLNASTSKIGPYLKNRDAANFTRSAKIAQRMKEIAGKLA